MSLAAAERVFVALVLVFTDSVACSLSVLSSIVCFLLPAAERLLLDLFTDDTDSAVDSVLCSSCCCFLAAADCLLLDLVLVWAGFVASNLLCSSSERSSVLCSSTVCFLLAVADRLLLDLFLVDTDSVVSASDACCSDVSITSPLLSECSSLLSRSRVFLAAAFAPLVTFVVVLSPSSFLSSVSL